MVRGSNNNNNNTPDTGAGEDNKKKRRGTNIKIKKKLTFSIKRQKTCLLQS